METVKISQLILGKIEQLENLKNDLETTSLIKATTSRDYDKNMALVTLKLRSEGTPASIIERLARGECADAKFDMEFAETKYKNVINIIHLTQAQLNGFQSINRHLSEA